jgi:hypothetical protein
MIGVLVSGVALAVQVPIASTFVVRVLAAAISAEPGGVLLSDIIIKSFSVLVTCWRGTSASGSVADREAAGAVGWANNAAAAVAKTANLKTLR